MHVINNLGVLTM